MAQYNIEISNKEEMQLAMQDLYSISKGRNYELKFLPKEEYDSLLAEKKSLDSSYEELKKKYDKLEKDYSDISDLLEPLESEKRQLKQETEDLKKKIEVMKNELAKYSVAYGVDDSNDAMYFMVDSGSLKQTKRQNAPYIANREGDKFKFKFNDNGPEIEACEKRSILLDPFCDIIEFTEGANRIEHKEMGYLEIKGATVNIKQKCKIKLIKV